ncbi:flagellar assembly protein FliH [Sutcliffiella cohnii]
MSNIIKSQYSTIKSAKPIKLTPITLQNDQDEALYVDEGQAYLEQIERAKDEASGIIQKANQYKEEVLQQLLAEKENWESEKVILKQEAFNEGYKNGYDSGESEAKKDYETIINNANTTMRLAKEHYTEKLDMLEEEMLKISIKIAEKIIGTALSSDEVQFVSFVRQALKEVKEKEEIKVFVSPNRFSLLIDNKESLQSVVNNVSEIMIFADKELSEWSCWIDSSAGRMDATVDTQLEQIKEKLLQLVQKKDA